MKVIGCPLIDLKEEIFFLIVPSPILPPGDRDTHSLRQLGEGAVKGEVLITHQKSEDITTGSTSETVENLLVLADHERGGLLTMEWAQGTIVLARFLQGKVLRDKIDNVHPLSNFVDCFRKISRQIDYPLRLKRRSWLTDYLPGMVPGDAYSQLP